MRSRAVIPAFLAVACLYQAACSGEAGAGRDAPGDLSLKFPDMVTPEFASKDPGLTDQVAERAPEPLDEPAPEPDQEPSSDLPAEPIPEWPRDPGPPDEQSPEPTPDTGADAIPDALAEPAPDTGAEPVADGADAAADGPGEVPAGCAPGAPDCTCTSSADCDQSYSGFCGENTCNKATGVCLVVAVKKDGTACDDQDPCTGADRCEKGVCAGEPLACDDEEVCTSDSCEPGKGCVHLPRAGPCEDGDPCTGPDTCSGGKCAPGQPAACDDHEVCTADECVAGIGCRHEPVDAPCDDHNRCTEGDHCEAGMCTPATLRDCDDGEPCTADGCLPLEGCVHTPIEGTCDDHDPCTAGDRCVAGKCVPGPVGSCVVCGDGECQAPDEDCKTCEEDCLACPPDCAPAPVIGCGAEYQGTTDGGTAAIDSYGSFLGPCLSFFSVAGPERVVPFVASDSVHARVTVMSSAWQSLDFFVLTENCAPDSCVAQGVGFLTGVAETTFEPVPGQTAWVTVDGGSATAFTMAVQCMEADCGDGGDDDQDGAADCADPDCGGIAVACGASFSHEIDDFSHVAGYPAGCGGAGGGSDDALFAFEVTSEQDIVIQVTPDLAEDRHDVYLLSGSCTGAACVAHAKGGTSGATLSFHAVPGTYRVVVEEAYKSTDSTGDFDLKVLCEQ